MLRYVIGDLSAQAVDDLRNQQAIVDAEATHQQRYAEAKRLFSRKSPKRCFDEVKSTLAVHSPPGNACFYCERDRYRDIEHIWPKRHYPEKCFNWQNYVYACTICNQDAKKDKFAVFEDGDTIVSFDRSLPFDEPVPVGDPVQIDIRYEDPLDFLQLDLLTGLFVPIGKTPRDLLRAEYTRDLFNLDSDALSRIRRQAVAHFTDYASRYIKAKLENRTEDAQRILSEIIELPHPTVIVEMRRQAINFPILHDLFQHMPQNIGIQK